MRESTVESTPSIAIGRPHGCEHRDTGLDCCRKAADESTPQALGASEPVDDQEVDAVSKRGHERGFSVNQPTLVEAAADRAGPAVFPDVEQLAGA